MCENVTKLNEILEKINRALNNCETMLIGQRPESCECVEEKADNCFNDAILRALKSADNAYYTLERIEMIFKGGNK